MKIEAVWLPPDIESRVNAHHPNATFKAVWPREDRFQKAVEKWVEGFGWKVYHTWDSMRSASGYPDLTAVQPVCGCTFWAELKSETGKLSPDQSDWLYALAQHNHAFVWRPSDEDEIWAFLQRHNDVRVKAENTGLGCAAYSLRQDIGGG